MPSLEEKLEKVVYLVQGKTMLFDYIILDSQKNVCAKLCFFSQEIG